MSNLFESGIRPDVDAYLKAKSQEVRDYGDYWSASSAGYCMRLNIMRRLKIPKVPELEDSAALTRIFEAGHIFHEWMQRITKDAGLSIASEVELQDEDLMIRGHIDDLVLVYGPEKISPAHEAYKDLKATKDNEVRPLETTKHLILYDYKTAHSASFNYSKNRPMGHYHTMQLATYLYMLRSVAWDEFNVVYIVDPRQLTEARILSISKDDLRMDEKQLLWSPDLEKEIVGYWRTLNGYWKAKTLPRCTCLDHDGGFMGKRSSKGKVYNDFFWEDSPCSEAWLVKHRELAEGWSW